MPNISTTRTAVTICIGLVLGVLMPPLEFAAVFLADYGFACFTQLFVKDAIALGDPWISVVFVLLQIVTLFFLARFNKTLAAAALVTATGVTIPLLKFTLNFPGFV